MAIGGGTFTAQNKVIPGSYINFVSASNVITIGSRGIAALPIPLNWGAEGKVISMDAGDFNRNAQAVFGYDPTAPELLLVREAFKRAKTLLVYRVNGGGVAAKGTIGGLTVTAKYSGTRGNDLKVAVLTNPDGGFDIVTYLGGAVVDTQTVTEAAELVANDYVTFAGDTLTAAAAAALTGGTNGEATGATYTAALTALEVEQFNVIGCVSTETSIKALFVAYAKRLREDEGKKIVAVLANQTGADYEGIISVKNGVVLEDGTVVGADQAVAWVTGASAAAEENQSLTNTVYEGAVDVTEKYTKTQYETAIKAGEFVFYGEGGKARVLADINTLTTFAAPKNADWTSNRLIRAMDGWATDVAVIFNSMYLGMETNNDTGRQLFKADLVSLAKQKEKIGTISNFDSSDIEIVQGNGKRDVAASCALQFNDSMEKLYMTITVQ